MSHLLLTIPFAGIADPVSSLSHLFGAVLFLPLGLLLLRLGRGDAGRLIYLGIYIFSVVFLLTMSGVYHMLPHHSAGSEIMVRLDHAAIFVMIAGGFTPAHGILFRYSGRWGMLTLIWGLALAGVAFKVIFFNSIPETLGLILYLGLGWFGFLSGAVLWRRFGGAFVQPLLLGGLLYSTGALLMYFNWPVLIAGVVGPHEVFHGFVLAGAFLHWRFNCQFADGTIPVEVERPLRQPRQASAIPVPVIAAEGVGESNAQSPALRR
jgi:channel protein (hemolysin III family)